LDYYYYSNKREDKMADKTSKLIALVTGVIFITLCATGIQMFFVDITSNYNVNSSGGGVNMSLFNSSSYSGLEEATEELESTFGEEGGVDSTFSTGGGSWFDTTWNRLRNSLKAMYSSIGITTAMVGGASEGIAGATGSDVGWLTGGLVIIITISVLLLIIGWWMNR
jgi:hypothetical protein